MSSLGINVGHTGGNMLAEAMIAARGVSSIKGMGGGFRSGGFSSGGHNSGGGSSGGGGISGGIGGKMFTSSMGKGGNFANNVIGTVARGSMGAVGSMTGETASQQHLLFHQQHSGGGAGGCACPH